MSDEYVSERGLWSAVLITALQDITRFSVDPIEENPIIGINSLSDKTFKWNLEYKNSAFRWVHNKVTYGRNPYLEGTPDEFKIFEYRTEEPGGFEWICELLDIDANDLRARTLSREGLRKLLILIKNRDRNVRDTKHTRAAADS